jgi:hypothetical protein
MAIGLAAGKDKMMGLRQSPSAQFLRPALLQEPVGRRVRCLTCERRCEILPSGLGWCRTRENRTGVLYTLTYGVISSLSANPIEKKPLYHFYPGSVARTSGAWSCNFGCSWYQTCDCWLSGGGVNQRNVGDRRVEDNTVQPSKIGSEGGNCILDASQI